MEAPRINVPVPLWVRLPLPTNTIPLLVVRVPMPALVRVVILKFVPVIVSV